MQLEDILNLRNQLIKSQRQDKLFISCMDANSFSSS